jgi:hypothetical protein
LDPKFYCTCILPHGGNGDYLITALVNDKPGELDLFLYSSLTHSWTIKTPVPAGDGSILHMTYIAIPVGGSMVAFVDIWTGILFCDVLDGERPKLHHLPLPSTGNSKESAPRVSFVSTPRDVIIQKVPGSGHLRIRFVEVVCSPIFEHWRVTSWSTTTAVTIPWCQLEGWRKYFEDVCDLDLSVADGVCYDGLLPETTEWDSDDDDGYEGQRTLGSLYLDMPRMSLHQDNVVCFIVKRYMEKIGTWIIAVDMSNKILRGVYNCQRLPNAYIFYSTVSIHVDMTAAPGKCMFFFILFSASSKELVQPEVSPFANFGTMWMARISRIPLRELTYPFNFGCVGCGLGKGRGAHLADKSPLFRT